MRPVPAAAGKNTRNAAGKTHKKENIEQLMLPDVFRRGEKIFFLFYSLFLSAMM
jgi:hypothetical protein